MRKNLLSLAIGAVAALSMYMAVPTAAVAQKATVLKLAHGAMPDQANGKAMLKFAELVAESSNGKVKIETHLAGSLYNERTSLEAIVNGAVDIGGASNANWAAFTPTLLFMDLPYVFSEEDSFREAMHGDVGQEIRKRFERDGFKLLMILDNGGFRHVVNTKRPLKVPADLKGLKIRTTASPVEIAMFREWGAIPTSIDWAEVYNALSSGVVDGEFVMPTWLATAKHYEVLKYATENRAVIGIQTVAMRKDRFDKLPKEAQEVLLAAAEKAQAYNNEIDLELSATARDYAVKLGVEFYQPTEDEMALWRESGRKIWKEFEGRIDQELFKIVLDSQKTAK